MNRRLLILSAPALLLQLLACPAAAQERPYFVTYDHYLEESRNLEIGLSTTSGLPRNGSSPYHAPWLEVEYGVKGWWTTELYLESVATRRDGSMARATVSGKCLLMARGLDLMTDLRPQSNANPTSPEVGSQL